MREALVFRLKGNEKFWAAITDDGTPFSIRLGRGVECELALPDTVSDGWTVSRVHARFFRHGDSYWIEDLGSKNLTFVNGRAALSPTKTLIPCELRLGSVTVLVERRELDPKDFERFFPPRPPLKNLPSTQGLDQLGIVDVKSREVLEQVREELHWASALQHVVEVLGESRRAEEAEFRVAQAFEVYLGAKQVQFKFHIALDEVQSTLKEAGIRKQVAALAKSVTETLDESPQDCFRKKMAQVLVWAASESNTDAQSISLIVAQLHKTASREVNTIAADRFIRLTLQIARSRIDTLREVESRRAATSERSSPQPTARMLAACEEASFWGKSDGFTKVLYEAERAAVSYLKENDARLPSVFFLGESGVGKSTLARMMHSLSDHTAGEFVEVNCATIPENIAESELFGHEKGAFTGADRRKIGLFELARNGTLFLDEIGTMGPAVQSKLLSVLDTGAFRRTGGNKTHKTNCYLILATNEDPEQLCSSGALREDLWYRIQTLTITLSPLRERLEDIDVLVESKFKSLNVRLSPHVPKRASDRLMRLLRSYSWPGNVRELTESLDAAFKMSPPGKVEIGVEDLPSRLRQALGVSGPTTGELRSTVDTSSALSENVRRLEREYLVRIIRECDGVKTKAAARAKISPQTLYNKLDEFRAWLHSPEEKRSEGEVACLRELAGPYWDVFGGSA